MIRKIIVALDGSREAGKALDVAMEFAAAFSAELILTHVLSTRPLSEDERQLAQSEYSAELQEALEGSVFMDPKRANPITPESLIQANRELSLAVRTALGRGIISRAEQQTIDKRLPTVKTVLRDGDPATELLATITEEKPDLLVIGKRGLSGFQKLLIGSVSSQVVASADCTVAVVR